MFLCPVILFLKKKKKVSSDAEFECEIKEHLSNIAKGLGIGLPPSPKNLPSVSDLLE